VRGREVDKSEAVILQGDGGEAFYFECEATARQHLARATYSAFGRGVAIFEEMPVSSDRRVR